MQEADEYATLIIQQVQEGYHTAEDVAEMKRCHEALHGVTPTDPDYVGLCRALGVLQAETRALPLAL